MDNESRSDATKGRLIQAAIESLAESGLEGTNFSEICRRSGLSRGAIHYHFASLSELLVDVIRVAGERIRDQAEIDFESLGPQADIYEEGIDFVWRLLHSNECSAFRRLLGSAGVSRDLQGDARREMKEVHQWLYEVADRLAGLGSAAADPYVTRIILSSLTGALIADEAIGPPESDPERLAFRAKLKELVLR